MEPFDIDVMLNDLKRARDAYYSGDEPIMGDDEYDALKNAIAKRGFSVGSDFEQSLQASKGEWEVKPHRRRMTGIGIQPTSLQELRDFVKDSKYSASLKLDGVSLELNYENRRLVSCLLRGDYEKGEDVFQNARKARFVFDTLPASAPPDLSVYGELVVSWNNLNYLNQLREARGLEPYKTPRNAVSSIRARTTSAAGYARYMAFIAFDFHHPDYAAWESHKEKMDRVKDWGFTAVDVDDRIPLEELWERVEEMGHDPMARQYQYDGVVVRLDGMSQMAKVKPPAQVAVTRVVDITETLGRTGIIAPLVLVEPVTIGGVVISKATGHNAVLMGSSLVGIGKGASVVISRRGDVIPHVERVVTPGVPWNPRSDCPSCGSDVVQDGSIRRCSADPTECEGTLVGLLIKFCRSVGIDGIGPGLATALVSAGVETPADLYDMTFEKLSQIEVGGSAVGHLTAAKVIHSISCHRRMTLGELMGALGIQGCASSVMSAVAAAYPDPSVWPTLSVLDLASVHGVGPERAENIVKFISTRWDDLVDPLLNESIELISGSGALNGKTFCITLGLNGISRTEMEAAIRRAGGDVKSSVSKGVTHLVCNFKDAGTSKHKRALELGIPIISQNELEEMMGATVAEPAPSPTDPF